MIAPLNIGAAPVCGGAPGSGSGAAAAEATPAASGCGFGARLEAAAPAPEAAGETTAAEAVEGAPVVVQPVVPAVPGGMAGVPAADVAAEAPLPAATVDQKDAATRLLRAQLFAVAEEVGAPAVPGARLHVWPQALPAGIPVSPVAAGAIPPIAAPAQPAPAAKSPPVAAVASYSVPAAAPHAPQGSPSTPVDGAGQAAATAEANARAPAAEATGGAERTVRLTDGVEVQVRPITMMYREAVRDLHERCSPETRRNRYFTATPALPPRLFERLCDRTRGQSFVACHDGQVVALASLLLTPEPGIGEIALLVEDRWQGRGLGRALANMLLQSACDLGLAEVKASMLSDNARMRRLLVSLGATLSYTDDPGLIDARIPVGVRASAAG